MGDGGECVTKASKGDVWEQTLSPGEQLNLLVEHLEPIKEKGLYGIRGNHGHRLYRETGLEWDEELCTRLSLPYRGASCLSQLILETPGAAKQPRPNRSIKLASFM